MEYRDDTPDGNVTSKRADTVLTTKESSRKNNWQRTAMGIALAGSLAANFVMWYQYNQSEKKRLAMQEEISIVSHNQERLTAQVDMYEKERQMLANPSVKTVILQSTQQAGGMTGIVFWNNGNGEAYVSLLNMPKPPDSKQYQFWVVDNGRHVDMGMISNDMVFGGMQKMQKTVEGGQAFAISMENKGGSAAPTEIMVTGKIPS